MKLFIDDERPSPDGWFLVKSFHEALDLITDDYGDITHIAFDWMLSKEVQAWNGTNLLLELSMMQAYDGIHVFHMPRSNYTCHSSDPEQRRKMECMLDILCDHAKSHDDLMRYLMNPKKSGTHSDSSKVKRLMKARQR